MENLNITYVAVGELKPSAYNPRRWSKDQLAALKESITRFGVVDPVICNSAEGRENVVIGGHMRLAALKELGHAQVPVVYVRIPELEREKELNVRLNKNLGEFDPTLLAEFDEDVLKDIGFSSVELDDVFGLDLTPETFNLQKELEKLEIKEVTAQKGDIYECEGFRIMVGDSTVEADMLKLMSGGKASMVMTDAPYRLDYLRGKKKGGKPTEGFGLKRDRKYLETDVLPPDFTEKWMANVAKVAHKDFAIISYENWKNIREQWNEMEKHWKVRNMIVWHLPNRVQGFSSKHKFFNKFDIAMLATSPGMETPPNAAPEPDELLQNEYETALYATSGKPHWEGYERGKKICPTDFIEFVASDEKSSGQGIIFGTKPVDILIPYIKVLTERGALVLEPFGGSGSTAVAALKLKRRCFMMEKSPIYASVIIARIEKTFGMKVVKVT